MTLCRDKARVVFKTLTKTSNQIRKIMQDHSSNTMSMHTFTETKLTYSGDNSTVSHNSHPKTIATYQNKSQAEQTIESSILRECKEDLPDDFIQKFHTINDTRYPCHPAEPRKYSSYSETFRACFACGTTEHKFGECPDRNTAEGKSRFHFELHCHKPETWFRNRDQNDNFRSRRE